MYREAERKGRRTSSSPRSQTLTISFQAQQYLRTKELDPTFATGARNAVETCLGLEPKQRFVLVAEVAMESIAASILRAAEDVEAEVIAFLIDAERAQSDAFVERLETCLLDADASLLACTVGGLPKAFRKRLIDVGGPRRRHAHLVGMTAEMMRQSMRADYAEVDRTSRTLARVLGAGKRLDVATPTGTRLEVRLDPARKWIVGSGLLREPGWTNLPGGEVYASPARVDGVLVPDGGVWLPDGTDLSRGGRVRLHFEDGRLARADGMELDEMRRLLETLDADPNGRRAGLVSMGTNTSILTAVGALLQDLKMPGFHLTLGHSASAETGADWDTIIEVPALVRRPDVHVDGEPVMVRGRYSRAITA